MPILIEAGLFSKLLSVFYDKKSKGEENDIVKALKQKTDNPAFNKAFDAWQKDSERLLITTRNALIRAGLSTDEIDNLLKKYHS